MIVCMSMTIKKNSTYTLLLQVCYRWTDWATVVLCTKSYLQDGISARNLLFDQFVGWYQLIDAPFQFLNALDIYQVFIINFWDFLDSYFDTFNTDNHFLLFVPVFISHMCLDVFSFYVYHESTYILPSNLSGENEVSCLL